MTATAPIVGEHPRDPMGMTATDRRPKDLADLSDEEFEFGLARLNTVKVRMQRILAEVLVEDAHYGNPKDKRGNPVFKKPMLYQAGAEELGRLLKMRPVLIGQRETIITAEFVSATVTVAHEDLSGRIHSPRTANCNTRDKRFKKFGDKDSYTYDDAREALHDCIAMAEKRAITLSIRAISGATAFLAAEEEMNESLEEDRPITPWTDAEKKATGELAQKKGIGRQAFAELVFATLGRAHVGTGEDVKKLQFAIENCVKPKKDEPAPAEPGDAQEDGAPDA